MIPSLKLTAKAPENQWLEDELSFWGPAYFQVLLLLVSGRVSFLYSKSQFLGPSQGREVREVC